VIDLGLDKLALIGAVALVVIGPEKLPRVARTVGHLVGKAQRYVAEVKAEVNRSIELEELKKMKTQFEDAARDVEHNVNQHIHQTASELNKSWRDHETDVASAVYYEPQAPVYKHPNKKWRLKRGATPQWYKQRHGVRMHATSGAARVARFRPPRPR
jgi:sec-independent protein translocase protein TatB